MAHWLQHTSRDGPVVRIADGAQASRGELITCTRNDRTIEPGEPGSRWPTGSPDSPPCPPNDARIFVAAVNSSVAWHLT